MLFHGPVPPMDKQGFWAHNVGVLGPTLHVKTAV